MSALVWMVNGCPHTSVWECESYTRLPECSVLVCLEYEMVTYSLPIHVPTYTSVYGCTMLRTYHVWYIVVGDSITLGSAWALLWYKMVMYSMGGASVCTSMDSQWVSSH